MCEKEPPLKFWHLRRSQHGWKVEGNQERRREKLLKGDEKRGEGGEGGICIEGEQDERGRWRLLLWHGTNRTGSFFNTPPPYILAHSSPPPLIPKNKGIQIIRISSQEFFIVEL